jgi:hypothetical protein
MSQDNALRGLSCPRCGGMVAVPEGQAIVLCPFCELRSVVQGERGVRRYQVPCRVERQRALQSYQKFFDSSLAMAGDVARKAQLQEVLLVHLPFWAAWGRGLGWVFGRKQVGSGDHKRYEPREVRIVEELDWNGAACDVGEFGVSRISLQGHPLEPANPDQLHRSGMVFEPVGSSQEALETARQSFQAALQQKARLDQVSQSFGRILRPRLGLVYYPLWVMRYLYRQRSFQVVVDGFSAEVLYGKAPGNTLYRAAVLVGGMAAGAFIGIDVPAFLLASSSEDTPVMAALAVFAAGMGIMYAAYRTFRFGEHHEYRRYKDAASAGLPFQLLGGVKEAGQLLNEIRRFTR